MRCKIGEINNDHNSSCNIGGVDSAYPRCLGLRVCLGYGAISPRLLQTREETVTRERDMALCEDEIPYWREEAKRDNLRRKGMCEECGKYLKECECEERVEE